MIRFKKKNSFEIRQLTQTDEMRFNKIKYVFKITYTFVNKS